MKNFTEKFKHFFSSDASLKRVPLYFLITCVLLVVLIFKLNQTNIYLQEIAANGTNSIELETDENYKDVVDVFIETTKSPEDIIPLLDEVTTKQNESTTKQIEITNKNVTANKQDETTVNQNGKTIYVLNINSKKIHLADCSFVDRTKDENKKVVELTEEELELYFKDGYTLCKTCGGK